MTSQTNACLVSAGAPADLRRRSTARSSASRLPWIVAALAAVVLMLGSAALPTTQAFAIPPGDDDNDLPGSMYVTTR